MKSAWLPGDGFHTMTGASKNRRDTSTCLPSLSRPGRASRGPPRLPPLLWLCLAATWVVWGSTYLAIKYALISFPPFLQMGSRFLVAGVRAGGVDALARRAVAVAGAVAQRLRRRRADAGRRHGRHGECRGVDRFGAGGGVHRGDPAADCAAQSDLGREAVAARSRGHRARPRRRADAHAGRRLPLLARRAGGHLRWPASAGRSAAC